MVDKVLTSAEVLKIATEILKWNLPLLLTTESLNKVKMIAGAALTQTHNHLKDQVSLRKVVPKLVKPNVTIDEIAKFNAFKKGLL